ncbi:hypothetical protein ABQ345_09340 [Serratia fonticola]|uniref:hypothetical protein n=1 Tax=Serratia fonticola TaxID=47917 RepID=UPI003AB0BE8E
MGMKSEGNTITCDCGFSFQRGQSGKHECADGLRAKLAAAVRREEGMKAIVDVMGLRITELEQRLQQPIPESLIAGICLTASDIYYENDEDKAQDIINRIRDELQGFKVEGE